MALGQPSFPYLATQRNFWHNGRVSCQRQRHLVSSSLAFGHRACTLACVIAALVAWARLASGAVGQTTDVFDEELSGYHRTTATGAVAALEKRLDAGTASLETDATHGYLMALLRELNISPSSQLLVASKTSPNRHLISPKNPRALYFSDQAAVAYVPGAPLLEVAATDAKLGVVFYTLDQKAVPRPRPVRDDRCLECHASAKTLDIPGFLVRSFRTDDDGEVDLLSGRMINHRTPIALRWGGYYVTGTHGTQVHLGNLFGAEARTRHDLNPGVNGNVTNLTSFLDVSKFPEPGSDIVALLVLDHQVHMLNLLTRLSYETVAATRRGDDLKPIYPATEAVLKYMLFTDEVPLGSPVRGTSRFAQWFESAGLKDKQGRSLRQFDLQTRLFKYPCSYILQSPGFESLPAAAKKHLWRRLWQILTNEDLTPEYQRLPLEMKRAIQEILIATQPDLPAYWRL